MSLMELRVLETVPEKILKPKLNEPATAIAKKVGTAKLKATVGTILSDETVYH